MDTVQRSLGKSGPAMAGDIEQTLWRIEGEHPFPKFQVTKSVPSFANGRAPKLSL